MSTLTKEQKAKRRANRSKSRNRGRAERPRLAVHASNIGIFAQFIDDSGGKTLLAGRDHGFKGTKTERAKALGQDLAKKAAASGITEIVFDRSGSRYHGRIAALADALREGGLKF